MEYMIPDLEGMVVLVRFVVVDTRIMKGLSYSLFSFFAHRLAGMFCLEQFPFDYKGGRTKCVG